MMVFLQKKLHNPTNQVFFYVAHVFFCEYVGSKKRFFLCKQMFLWILTIFWEIVDLFGGRKKLGRGGGLKKDSM